MMLLKHNASHAHTKPPNFVHIRLATPLACNACARSGCGTFVVSHATANYLKPANPTNPSSVPFSGCPFPRSFVKTSDGSKGARWIGKKMTAWERFETTTGRRTRVVATNSVPSSHEISPFPRNSHRDIIGFTAIKRHHRPQATGDGKGQKRRTLHNQCIQRDR
jgi:hypothetical protein